MKCKLSILTDRVQYLVDELGSRIELLKQDEQWSEVEITINDSFELLSIFHAGCRAGLHIYGKLLS